MFFWAIGRTTVRGFFINWLLLSDPLPPSDPASTPEWPGPSDRLKCGKKALTQCQTTLKDHFSPELPVELHVTTASLHPGLTGQSRFGWFMVHGHNSLANCLHSATFCSKFRTACHPPILDNGLLWITQSYLGTEEVGLSTG